MLHWTVRELLEAHGLEPEAVVDTRRSLNVERSDVIVYLRSHRGEAERYFAEHAGFSPFHEALLLERDGTQYSVSVNDHGTRRFIDTFDDIDEAVAAHVLATYGKS
jgi:hypothetical protein